MGRFTLLLLTCVLLDWLVVAAEARAQADLSGCKVYQAQMLSLTFVDETIEAKEEKHTTLEGTPDQPVQIDCDEMQFFADHMETYRNAGRVIARGNVLFVSGTNRISAERMEFNTKTRTGTFYVASGITTLRENGEQQAPFGSQEPEAYFYGEELHKLGPRKYRIVRGGFTTCVQPTPRWEVVSGSITLNLDHYAILTNALFKVKDVPLMYLPVFYYPINDEDRSTGFLIPIYGAATIAGQKISNQFFWAISRSQDATFSHDWLTKTGQGLGAEYRYVAAPGSQGNTSVYFLNEHAFTYTTPQGTAATTDPKKSYSIQGNMSQRLPLGLQARANIDYFSSIVTQQRYQQDIYQATNRTRRFGSNVTGSWGPYSLSATADRVDTFYGADTVIANGSLPRITFSRGERQIGRAPLYFGVTSEFASFLRSRLDKEVRTQDQGLTRMDVLPTLRVPFTKWPFLSVNSSVSWRGTYWTESLSAGTQVPESVGRQYTELVSRITGPVFNRIWNPPDGGTKFKHVVEPSVTIRRTTAIDNLDRIVQLEGADFTVGSVTRFDYGVTNRLYAKKDVAREVLSATLTQSYYTDARASQYDRQFQSSFSGAPPTHYSPVALVVRGSPSDRLQADFRTEWDPTAHTLRTLAANGTFRAGGWLQTSAGWSQRRFIKGLPGFDNRDLANNYLNASASLRAPRNRISGSYAFNYDIGRDQFLQQRIVAFYNTQCCGVGFEYQTFNTAGSLVGLQVPRDRRFNISFTLSGIGTFSNPMGAFGGGGQRR